LSETQVDQLWLEEAARRADEINPGLSGRVPVDEGRRQAQALLK
jgi:hypothetical protein